jgi:hypothetical protein
MLNLLIARGTNLRHNMKRTVLSFGASLLCAAMAFAQQQTQPSQPDQKPADQKQTEPTQDQSSKDDSSKSLSPTGPHMMKASDRQTIKATVEDVDQATRTVTLKGENGKTVSVKCGDEVRNFDQIKAGDQVTVKFYQSVALALRKSDEPPSAEEQRAVLRAEPGEKPGGAVIKTMQVSATIESIDKATRQVTLKGPEGKTKTVKVGDEVKNFDNLKEGDQVMATVTEALAIDVSKPSQ